MKIFCDRLRETRGSLSQKAFAAALGLNQQTYQRYESGLREPDLEHLHRIGVSCGVSIDWLLGLPERGGGNHATANGDHAIANISGTVTVSHPPTKDCETCPYKQLADAFRRLP